MTSGKDASDNYGIQIGAGGSFSAETVVVGDHARIENWNSVKRDDALNEILGLKAELQRIQERPASMQRVEGACQELENAVKEKSPDVPKIRSRLEEIASIMKAGGSVVEETLTILGYVKKIAVIFGLAIAGL